MNNPAVFQAQSLHNAELRRVCREALDQALVAQMGRTWTDQELIQTTHQKNLLSLQLMEEKADHRLTRALRPLRPLERRRRRARRLTSGSSRSRYTPLQATTESPSSGEDSEATLTDPTYADIIREAEMQEALLELDELAEDDPPLEDPKQEPKLEPADEGYEASA